MRGVIPLVNDRMTLTLFGLGREQEAAIRDVFEARGWDYVHELSLPLLPN